MCIIAIKPQDKPMFPEDTIRTMFTNNPDGAGYMYVHRHGVRIRKGFMTVESFLDSIASVPGNVPAILHFRIGTHGGNTPSNTHPFPITFDVEELKKRRIDTPLGMVHNGIISGMFPRPDISDTMEYILTVVAPLMALSPHAYMSPHGKQILDVTCDSKLAFLDFKGHIETVGEFITVDGYQYSNDSYLPRVYTSRKYTGFYNAYFDDDDEYTLPTVWRGAWVSPVTEDAYIMNREGNLVELLDDYFISETGGLYVGDDDAITYIGSDIVHNASGGVVKYNREIAEYKFFTTEGEYCTHS